MRQKLTLIWNLALVIKMTASYWIILHPELHSVIIMCQWKNSLIGKKQWCAVLPLLELSGMLARRTWPCSPEVQSHSNGYWKMDTGPTRIQDGLSRPIDTGLQNCKKQLSSEANLSKIHEKRSTAVPSLRSSVRCTRSKIFAGIHRSSMILCW